MRGLVVVVLVTLLVGCGGGAGEDDAGNTAPTQAVSAAATTAASSPSATAISASVAQVASPTIAQASTPARASTSSPTATEAVPTPIVVGSPAAGLPTAGQITATVLVGVSPFVVAAGHGAIWVQNDMDGTLSRIDPATNMVVATIPIATAIDPLTPPSELLGLRQASPDLAIDANSVWATKPAEQAVVQVDPQTNTVVATIPLEAKATSIAVAEASLWVSLFGTASVARVDTLTGEVVATIPGVPAPAGIAIQPDAIWVANYFGDTITRIDPATNKVVAKIAIGWPGAQQVGFQCGLCPTEVLATDDGVWVTLMGANAIARIDPAINRLAAVIPVGVQPKTMASDARGVWVGHKGSAGVLLIDSETNQVVAAVPATDAPNQLPAIALAENTLWVARLPTNDIVRIEVQLE